MKKAVRSVVLAGCLFASLGAASFDIGISGSDRGISGFALSIGNYYRVPERDIIVIERRIPRDELSVVYLLANRSHRHASYIADLRLGGLSWWDITLRLGLDPYTLYAVNSSRHSGPPYGKAYGYYKEGKKHRLRDDEIVELSNVRFLSKYHRVSVDDVIDRRRSGEHYSNIDDHYRSRKAGGQQSNEQRQNVSPKERSQGQERNPGGSTDKGPGEKDDKGQNRNPGDKDRGGSTDKGNKGPTDKGPGEKGNKDHDNNK